MLVSRESKRRDVSFSGGLASGVQNLEGGEPSEDEGCSFGIFTFNVRGTLNDLDGLIEMWQSDPRPWRFACLQEVQLNVSVTRVYSVHNARVVVGPAMGGRRGEIIVVNSLEKNPRGADVRVRHRHRGE